MATSKRTAKKQAAKPQTADAPTGVTVGRPLLPPEYGVPKDRKGLLAWSHVTERMEQAMHYWVCTVTPDGRPHATPVDGLWLDDRFYFGGSPKTKWSRNLTANPAVSIHLENGAEAVILRGDALPCRADKELAARLAKASQAKYGFAPPPGAYESGEGAFVLRPHTVLAWRQFFKDATRWQFRGND